jgi:KipI family sensor histidine kinase inhibitor
VAQEQAAPPTDVDLPLLQPAGDSALLVTFGRAIDLAANRRAQALARALAARGLAGRGEAVPGYASVLVHYDPLALTYPEVEAWLQASLSEAGEQAAQPRLVEIPVRYGGEDGPDLAFVAGHSHLAPEEVVRRHTARDYPVYMMGFTPGFPYLGGLDPSIAAPRLPTPRSRVPGGSVGIAGEQTGVYPLDSPGGWRIIGRTPLRLFDPHRDPPFLLEPGDLVRFAPVTGEAGQTAAREPEA